MSRILIAGISSNHGGRVARALEADPGVQAIVGIDTADPRHELERTEFVRVDMQPALLRRILAAAAIDTVIDVRLITDPLSRSDRVDRVNVRSTKSLLEACAGLTKPLCRLVFKSSSHFYGSEADGPAFFTEEMERRHPPRTPIERSVVAMEDDLRRFASEHPATTVTVLRVVSEIGNARLPLLSLPVVPGMLGFDPRCQFVHDDDIVAALVYVAQHDLPGPYNVAGDGVLAWSEVASLLGKPLLPIIPPWGAGFTASQLRRLGLPVPLESVRQLRYGQGLDNRRLKAAGFSYRYTTREAVLKLRAQQRLRPLLRGGTESYRYEREVEDFLRWSPSVRSLRERGEREPAPGEAGAVNGSGLSDYDHLTAGEVIGLISSLEPEAAARLRRYEAAHRGRKSVLEALDRRLAGTKQPEN